MLASGQKKSNPMVNELRKVSPDSPSGTSTIMSTSGVIEVIYFLIARASTANKCVSTNFLITALSVSPSPLTNSYVWVLLLSSSIVDKDAITDKSERFFIEEIIREKILKHYKKEIPYSVQIEVEEFFEEEEIIKIRAIIYVLRQSQKGIIIGHKGMGLKRIGSEARRDIEKMLDKKVFLATPVKVKKNWRNDKKQLKKFGYE